MFIPRLRQVVIILAFLSILLIAPCSGVPSKRVLKLQHKLSQHTIMVTSKTVTTKNMRNLSQDHRAYTDIEFKFVKKYKVKLFAVKASRYICINSKGKMIPRQHYIKKRCEFEEVYTSHFKLFRLTSNKNWCLGFDKKGRPLNPVYKQACNNSDYFQFTDTFNGSHVESPTNQSYLGTPTPATGRRRNRSIQEING